MKKKLTDEIVWKTESRKISELKSYYKNPRKFIKKGMADLGESLKKFGLAELIVINLDNVIIGGHARIKVLKKQGKTKCNCQVPNRMLTDEEVEELNIRLNKNTGGVFDMDILANQYDYDKLLKYGFDEKELLGNMDEPRIEAEVEFTEELLEEHNYVVLYFDNAVDWLQAETVLGLKTVKALNSKKGFEKKGVGRVLRGTEAIERIRNA
jgi:hypothetical protein